MDSEYALRADLEAATPASAVKVVHVYGRSAVDDNGGGSYKRVGSQPTHAAKIQSADGQWWELVTGAPVTPEMFGSTGVASTDEPALAAMATYTNTVGGKDVTWSFKPGKTYKVFANPTPGTHNELMKVGATTGLRVHTNGCRFESDFDWINTADTTRYFMVFVDAVDLVIDAVEFRNTVSLSTVSDSRGVLLLTFSDACRGVRVGPVRMTGGVSAVGITQSPNFNGSRARGFVFELIDTTNTFYGLNPQRNGDHVTAKLRTANAGRAYFPVTCSYHTVEVDLNDTFAVAQTVVLNCACEPGGENKLTNIDVTVGGTHFGSVVVILFQQYNPTPTAGRIHNINVRFRLESASGAAGNLVEIVKQNGGVFDPSVRNHSIVNVTISGICQNLTSGVSFAQLFKDGDWTGEHVSNVGFRDLVVTQIGIGGIDIDGRGIEKNLFFENVDARWINATLANIPQGVLEVGPGVYFNNLFSVGSSGVWNYERIGHGRIRMTARATLAAAADTNIDFPVALRSPESAFRVEGLVNVSATGNADMKVAFPSTSRATVTRASTSGTPVVDLTVVGDTAANGSPI